MGNGQTIKMDKSISNLKFPLAPMGVLAPGSAQARPSPQPLIDTNGNFSARMSGGKHFKFFNKKIKLPPMGEGVPPNWDKLGQPLLGEK